MKKILILLFSFFYLVLTSGMILNFHYCGGKIKSISLFSSSDEVGCCGSKMKSKNCCKDKTAYVKVKDNHNSNPFLKFITFKGQMLEIAIPSYLLAFQYSLQVERIQNYYPPPVLYDNPLYLKHKVLII